MKFKDKKLKLDLLLEWLEKGNAGNTKVLSSRLFVSPRTLRRCLDDLRDQGHEISFCMNRNTFYLEEYQTLINKNKFLSTLFHFLSILYLYICINLENNQIIIAHNLK